MAEDTKCKNGYINSRVFGSDIAAPIKDTLLRRQQQTLNPQFGESLSSSEWGFGVVVVVIVLLPVPTLFLISVCQ